MKKLANKTVLITGNLLGTGRACAIAAAREGANVVVADKRTAITEEAMQEIKNESRNSVFVECDVTNFHEVQTAIETTTILFPTIDVILNNSLPEVESDSGVERCRELWADKGYADPGSIYNCLGPQLEQMSRQKRGVIVNMSADLDKTDFVSAPRAVRATHGVNGLTKTSALEYAAEGIRINAIRPALHVIRDRTLTWGRTTSDTKKHEIESGKPEDVANLFIFLASDQSSFVFGTTLEIERFI